MKVVINTACGVFSLSKSAMQEIAKLKNWQFVDQTNGSMWWEDGSDTIWDSDISRSDPDLITTVESLGPDAWGDYSELKIVNIPNDINWYVHYNDSGIEHVAEYHRTWR